MGFFGQKEDITTSLVVIVPIVDFSFLNGHCAISTHNMYCTTTPMCNVVQLQIVPFAFSFLFNFPISYVILVFLLGALPREKEKHALTKPWPSKIGL